MGMLFPGDTVESYMIMRLLGEGGMNYVYLVEHKESGRLFAMKVTKDLTGSDSDAVEVYNRFLREISILTTVSHQGLPHIEDYFTRGDLCYIIEEYIEGKSLEEALLVELPSQEQAARWGMELCAILEVLHGNDIIFRDLKPSNIIIGRDGELKLVDFDIARRYVEGKAHDTMLLGTPGYAAPETYGKAQSDARSDIYSLGATLHHLMTGMAPLSYPFQFQPLEQLKPDVDRAFAALIMKSLSDRPEHRFGSAREMRESLEVLFPEAVPPPPKPSPVPPQAPVTPAAPVFPQAQPPAPGAISRFFNTQMGNKTPLQIGAGIIMVVLFLWGLVSFIRLLFPDELRPAPPGTQVAAAGALEPSVNPKRDWGNFGFNSQTVYPPTYCYYPSEVAKPHMTIRQKTDSGALFPHLEISFEFQTRGSGSPYTTDPHELTLYCVMPTDGSYLVGGGKFSTIRGGFRKLTLKTRDRHTCEKNRATIYVGEKGGKVKGSVIYDISWDDYIPGYSPDKPWQGPRVLLYMKAPDYSWEYTKGFIAKYPL
ncbi:MAG: serine/threonine-protein kinase [Candidatus Eremiobacteraeota bacterium]|nr:serine/threonine-protein kinase [Candidatus Eremiobacteraeota bacterium]